MPTRATEVADAPADETFAAALKRRTWVDHDDAEYTAYMQALLAGALSRDEYADLVAQHYFAYRIIEDAAGRLADDPLAGPFIHASLNRTAALEDDLRFLLGDAWRERITPNEGTTAYVSRLEDVCYRWPGGFVAHHYTRYLGDLSGGQVIRAAAERAFGLEDGRGVQFYVFPEIADHREFKRAYRASLDAAPWDADERELVVDEVLFAYRLNAAVLAASGRNAPTMQRRTG
jgi:heme oxygenase